MPRRSPGPVPPTPCRSRLRRRNTPAGRDAQRHAGPARVLASAATRVRRRCRARAALAADQPPYPAGGRPGDRREPDTADLLAEVDRLTALVDDLLLLARMDDADPPARASLDLGRWSTTSSERYAAPGSGRPDRAGPPCAARGQPGALRAGAANLLDNAVRYAASAVIGHRAAGEPTAARCWDRRRRPGIPVEDRERVFERFSRLHDARDRGTGGSGLGLAIVRELVGQQGGSVRCRRRRGCGPTGPAGGGAVPAQLVDGSASGSLNPRRRVW